MSERHVSEDNLWRDTREGILHLKKGIEYCRRTFCGIIVSTNGSGSRTNKLKPFSIKAEEMEAPLLLWYTLLRRVDPYIYKFIFSLDLSNLLIFLCVWRFKFCWKLTFFDFSFSVRYIWCTDYFLRRFF